MRIVLRPRSVPALCIGLLAAACQAPQGTGGAATGTSVTRAAEGIERGRQQLDETVTALTALVESPAPDLDPQFDAFTQSLDRLEATASDVKEMATQMQERGAEYFKQWDEQLAAIQNEDIRKRSEKRRKAVEEAFEDLRKDYAEAREAFQPLMDDLRDVRTALANDLTMGGLESIESVAKRVKKRAGPVGEELDDLAASFRDLGVGMSQAGPAATDSGD